MNREKTLKLLKGGPKGVAEWNRRREAMSSNVEHIQELWDPSKCDLRRTNLRKANLSHADLRWADLRQADLRDSILCEADFYSADLSNAKLSNASLKKANLKDANLSGADLSEALLFRSILTGVRLPKAHLRKAKLQHADVSTANLHQADLRGADLFGVSFTGSYLDGADLRDTQLWDANFSECYLHDTRFSRARLKATIFANVDLSNARGLGSVVHDGPSTVGCDTLVRSEGNIPEKFLRGCGFQPWQILEAKLYDPDLTALQIAGVQAEGFRLRTEGPIFFGGIFISYTRDDSRFVDKLRDKLRDKGISVWVDRHDAVAGSVDRQVVDAIRLHDIVLLVLSRSSVDSEWVEYELEKARQKEKSEKRDVLCPIALDGSWKAKLDDVLWRQIKKKNVLDFSAWINDPAFDPVFRRLLDGMKKYYPPKGKPKATESRSP